MKTALYRIRPRVGHTPTMFTCTIRQDGRVVDEHTSINIGRLFKWKRQHHPDAVTIDQAVEKASSRRFGAPERAPDAVSDVDVALGRRRGSTSRRKTRAA